MWYERNRDLIWFVTGCCGCSIWACWRLMEGISSMQSSCSWFFLILLWKRSFFLNFNYSLFFWSDLLYFFVRNHKSFAFVLGRMQINWVHVRPILRPLRRVLVLVICTINILIANSLDLFVSLNCNFTFVFFVTITIFMLDIFLVSLKAGSICLNQSGSFDGARRLSRFICTRKSSSGRV